MVSTSTSRALRVAGLAEQTLARPDQDRNDNQPQLSDQVVL
jgi:hypothetical protein